MFESGRARRLIFLGAVVAGIGAQSIVTPEVEAHQSVSLQTYGVRLLKGELTAPVSPTRHHTAVVPPPVAELDGSATILFVGQTSAAPTSERRLLGPPWLEVTPNRFSPSARHNWPERRDASGALIELSENDVLIPARLPY